MTLWQFSSAWSGYVEAHSPKEQNKLSDADIESIWDSGWLEVGAGADEIRHTVHRYHWDGKRLVID